MSLLNKLLKESGKVYGIFRATVKDNLDPEKRGRVRVFCPSLMDGPETSKKQWFDWAMPAEDESCGSDCGFIRVPRIGAKVYVFFEGGNIDFPVYLGGFFTKVSDTIPLLAKGLPDPTTTTGPKFDEPPTISVSGSDAGSSTYPYNTVYKSPEGLIIEVDETPFKQRIRVRHPSGSFWEMFRDGSIAFQAIGNFEAYSGTDINFIAVDNFQVAANLIKLGSGLAILPVLVGTPAFVAAFGQFIAAAGAIGASSVGPSPTEKAAMVTALAALAVPGAMPVPSTKVFTSG